MNAEERRQRVLQHIIETGAAQVEEIAALCAVSRMTAHRDLDTLESQGLVRRVRGGATARASALVESAFRVRSRLAPDSKAAIAAAAIRHVETGQAVILDDSTTALAMVDLLPALRPLSVITNGLEAILRLREIPGIDLIALGGRYNPRYNSFLGLPCERALADLRTNVAFLSTSAILGDSAFHQEAQVVGVKRAMMAATDRPVLLADHGKFGTTALHRLANLSEFERVISDDALSEGHRRALAAAGVTLELAGAQCA